MVCSQMGNCMNTELRKALEDEKVKTLQDCKLKGDNVTENA